MTTPSYNNHHHHDHQHRQKRLYQPSLSNYLARSSYNLSNHPPLSLPLHHISSHREQIFSEHSEQQPALTPSLPNTIQASLLSVGMRVRKAVPEGYKKTSVAGVAEEDKENIGFGDKMISPPSCKTTLVLGGGSDRRTSRNEKTRRELAPYCAMLDVGGLQHQRGWQQQQWEEEGSSAMDVQEDDDDDARLLMGGEREVFPGEMMFDDSEEGQDWPRSGGLTTALNRFSQPGKPTSKSRKRTFGDDDYDEDNDGEYQSNPNPSTCTQISSNQPTHHHYQQQRPQCPQPRRKLRSVIAQPHFRKPPRQAYIASSFGFPTIKEEAEKEYEQMLDNDSSCSSFNDGGGGGADVGGNDDFGEADFLRHV